MTDNIDTQVLAAKGDGRGADLGGAEDWDMKTFFENATQYSQVAGGAFLSLMGVIGLIWGGVLLLKKLMSEQSRESWVKIVALLLVGGALLASGITLLLNFAQGGATTIEDLGGGGAIFGSFVG